MSHNAKFQGNDGEDNGKADRAVAIADAITKQSQSDDAEREREESAAVEIDADGPHAQRRVGISVYPNKTTVAPTVNKLDKWQSVRGRLMRRDVRVQKDGPLLGGYITKGKRRNADVVARSLIQLDIDTKTKTNAETGQKEIASPAPSFNEIRHHIDEFEYVAASSHSHDPAQGTIKYRITILPDRDIKRDEYEPLLEALDERLGGGVLDRDAWQWSQAFYLPSCPRQQQGEAFAFYNQGNSLSVDEFVTRGRQILAANGGGTAQSNATVSAVNIGRAPPPVEEMRAMLRFLAERNAFEHRTGVVKHVDGRIIKVGWIETGMALKLAYGDQVGFELWAETHTDNQARQDAPDQWTSFDDSPSPNQVTIATIIKAAKDAGFGASPPAVQLASVNLSKFSGDGSDVKNGVTFADAIRNRLLYIHETGDWLIFQVDTGWLAAPPGEADRAAKEVLKLMRAEAAQRYMRAPEDPKTKRLMAHVKHTSKAHNLRAMIEMAKSEPSIMARLSDFDSDPMVIGLKNCVFDLGKWEYREPTPTELISKRANVIYDSAAKYPLFRKFLKEIQPDLEVRKFLRRFMGYSLTGRADAQVFAFFYGHGANGKSVFVELMAWLLGDYARKIPTEMLMQHQRNPAGPSPDIVALKGMRLVFANETEEGRRLAEAWVKDLTGGDTLSGRVPYSKAGITFTPTHKLIIVGNHKPEITDNSNGMWRRVVLVPFEVTIQEGVRDPHLLEKLKVEGPGILNWLLRGFKDYKTNGLNVPNKIKAATAAYREEQDIIGDWIADNCVTGTHLRDSKAALYADYAVWAKSNGHNPLAQTRLTRRLGERGFKLSKDKRSILGIAISNGDAPLPLAGASAVGPSHPGSPSMGSP